MRERPSWSNGGSGVRRWSWLRDRESRMKYGSGPRVRELEWCLCRSWGSDLGCEIWCREWNMRRCICSKSMKCSVRFVRWCTLSRPLEMILVFRQQQKSSQRQATCCETEYKCKYVDEGMFQLGICTSASRHLSCSVHLQVRRQVEFLGLPQGEAREDCY